MYKRQLYVLVNVKAHEFFKRDGANLFCRVPIPMTTAALGDEIEVPTINGSRTKVKIPGGTQTGQQFRLREKGMPIINSHSYGDLYIEIFVETPVNLNTKQKKLFTSTERYVMFVGSDRMTATPYFCANPLLIYLILT